MERAPTHCCTTSGLLLCIPHRAVAGHPVITVRDRVQLRLLLSGPFVVKQTVSSNNARNPSLSRGLLETSKTLFLPSGSIMASATPCVSGQGRCPHALEDRGVGCSSLDVYRTISIFVTRIQQMIPTPCCTFYERPA